MINIQNSLLKKKLFKAKTKLLKDDRKLRNSKFNAGKVVIIGFWAIVLGTGFLSFQAFNRTGFLNEKMNGYQQEAAAQLETLNKSDFVTSPAGEDYTRRFIQSYVNIPEDQAGRDKRSEKLQQFFAEGIKLEKVESLSEFNGKRVLKDIHLYKIQDVKKDSAQYLYRITYDTTSISEQKQKVQVKKGKKKTTEQKTIKRELPAVTKEVLIAVPVGTDGKTFNVIEQPHYEAIPAGKRLSAVRDSEDRAKQDFKKEEELKQFATQFFTSYTENTEEEMSYLMKDPESLKDLYEYQGLEDFIVYEGGKGEYLVKALVDMKETGSGLSVKQPFTLTISKQNGKLYVKKINHTIGG